MYVLIIFNSFICCQQILLICRSALLHNTICGKKQIFPFQTTSVTDYHFKKTFLISKNGGKVYFNYPQYVREQRW